MTKTTKTTKITKRCEICQTRPVMTAKERRQRGVSFPYCGPCMDLADWENTHSDDAHEAVNSGEISVDEAMGLDTRDGCWICHPELDETREEYKAQAGTSRKSARFVVTSGDKLATKLGIVEEELRAKGFKSVKRNFQEDGITTITANLNRIPAVEIVWHGRRFVSAQISGRKLRNVSDVIRYLSTVKK